MRVWLTIGLLIAMLASAHADVLLPLQFGGALLDVTTGTCSNSLDFSKGCNSQYVGIM